MILKAVDRARPRGTSTCVQGGVGCLSYGHLNGVRTPDFSRPLCDLHTKSIVKDEVSAHLKTPAALTWIPGNTVGWVKKTRIGHSENI